MNSNAVPLYLIREIQDYLLPFQESIAEKLKRNILMKLNNTESHYYKILLPPVNKLFKENLLARTDVIPTRFLEIMVQKILPSDNWLNNMEIIDAIHMKRFEIEELRTNCLICYGLVDRLNWKVGAEDSTYKELTKYDRDRLSKPFTKFQLQEATLPFFLKTPKLYTWDELLKKHLMYFNPQQKVRAKTKQTAKKVKSKEDTQEEIPLKRNVWGNPWKSKHKIKAYSNRYNLTEKEFIDELTKYDTDTWDQKKQRKLMKHFYGPRYSFVIDYMFASPFAYMIAINMNTRKAFAIPAQKIHETEQYWKFPTKIKETATEAVETLKKLLKQTPVKHLLSDQEPAWTSKTFQDFCKLSGIKHRFYHKNDVGDIIETNEKSRGNHSCTSLVDRLIRTLRVMGYNLTGKSVIDPDLMKYLITEYNNSPHSTLSKYLKKPTTPEEVDSNRLLEEEFVQKLVVENISVMLSPEYKVNRFVRVRNEASVMDKVKPKLLPGYWEVIGKDGGLLKLKQDNKEIKINRWLVKNPF